MFLGIKPTFEARLYYFHEKKKIFPTHFLPTKRGERNVWTAKTPSRIVFGYLTLPFLRKKSNEKFSPPTFNPQKKVKNYYSKNSFRDRLCRPLFTIFTKKNRIKNFTPECQPPKRGENVMTAKIPAEIVFVVPCEPFSRKKSNKKISPPTFNPRKGVKNDMSAKIPTGIVFVGLSKPFSHKKSKTIFFTPTFVTPFPRVLFTFSR